MQPFLGEIRAFPWDFAPRGWALCNGALIPIQQNTALFSLLGTSYGGDGRVTFGLPDLRGRTPAGRSESLVQGTLDGAEQVALTTDTMPAHIHQLYGTSTIASLKSAAGAVFANDTAPGADFYAADTTAIAISPMTLETVGGGQPHPNMQPYLVVNYCVALQGVFPSRN